MSQYYFRIYGVNFGPTSLEWLQREIASGKLSGAEVRSADETSWTRVADFVAQGLTHQTQTTQTTQSGPTPEPAEIEAKTLWYVRMGRAEHGPIEFQKLIDMVTAGRILPMDRVRQADQAEWTIAQVIPSLFSSNSGSLPGGSSFSLEPTRPSIAGSTGSMQREYTPPPAAIPQAAPTSVHHAAQPPFQLAAQTATYTPAKDIAQPQRSVLQTLNNVSDLKVESTRQSNLLDSPRSHLERGRNVDVDQPQPKSGPYPKFKGEIKLKPRTRQVGDSQPLLSWNLIMAAAGCVLIIFIGRSMIL